jgi:hypothetical protein
VHLSYRVQGARRLRYEAAIWHTPSVDWPLPSLLQVGRVSSVSEEAKSCRWKTTVCTEDKGLGKMDKVPGVPGTFCFPHCVDEELEAV